MDASIHFPDSFQIDSSCQLVVNHLNIRCDCLKERKCIFVQTLFKSKAFCFAAPPALPSKSPRTPPAVWHGRNGGEVDDGWLSRDVQRAASKLICGVRSQQVLSCSAVLCVTCVCVDVNTSVQPCVVAHKQASAPALRTTAAEKQHSHHLSPPTINLSFSFPSLPLTLPFTARPCSSFPLRPFDQRVLSVPTT